MNDSFLFTTEKEMRNWSYQLGRYCQGKELFLLAGDLGAGKTTFTKGLAKGLGLKDLVTSPTFTYLNIYNEGPLRLCHYDLYRLHSPDDLEALGFFDYLGEAVIAIEWAEKAKKILPDDFMEISFLFHSRGRKITVHYQGPLSKALISRMEKQNIETTGH